MTLGKVIDTLYRYIAVAWAREYVRKPFSWALYQTWKWCDALEKARTGVWLYSSFFGGCYRCSVCGHDQASKTDFCPECGAKMEREEESDGKSQDNDI